jgi:Domain of unknown function (DUF5943)
MAELPVPVVVEPETGAWSVDGQPMILVPRHFWAFIQMECERRFGIDGARSVFDAATNKAAKVWCAREAKTHGLEGVEVFEHYLKRVSQRGFGQFTIEKIDPEAGTATIRLEHSVYVAEYGREAGRRVCYMFASAFTGGMEYVAEAAGHPRSLAAEEIQCGAEGAECCRYEVRPTRGV